MLRKIKSLWCNLFGHIRVGFAAHEWCQRCKEYYGPQLQEAEVSSTVLTGDDVKRLLLDLDHCASPQEMSRRIDAAKEVVAELMRPKGFEKRPPQS